MYMCNIMTLYMYDFMAMAECKRTLQHVTIAMTATPIIIMHNDKLINDHVVHYSIFQDVKILRFRDTFE